LTKQMELEEFEAVFHCYKNMVFKLAYLTLGNVQEAEDVMQEVFIKVYRAQNSFRPEKGNFNSWLRRITINQIISRRRRKSLPSLSLEVLEEEGAELPEDSPLLPDEFLIKQEESRRIQEAIKFLNRKHSAILVMRYYDNLSYDEIARVLEIPLGTVKSRINTAIKALRKELVEKEAAP
jgi:RNA polymerase sigma-70 factor, ECF subfamily